LSFCRILDMTTLADSFLEDLEGLGDDSDEFEEKENEERKPNKNELKEYNGVSTASKESSHSDKKGRTSVSLPAIKNDDTELDLDAMLGSLRKANTLENVAQLRKSKKFVNHIRTINTLKEEAKLSTLPNENLYDAIIASNNLIRDIDEEVLSIHKFVAEIYSKKFPELESIVPNVIDYVRTVKEIGNEMDMTVVDLSSILPSVTIINVTMMGSTSGRPLAQPDLEECLNGCDEVLGLIDAKQMILSFVESQMNTIAPSVCAIIGSSIAAQLLGHAGGLINLAAIPACNLQVIGQEKKNLSGYSSKSAMLHTGILYNCDLIQTAPPVLRQKALKVTAAKVALAARVDAYEYEPSGTFGKQAREQIEEKIEKWQEPPKARTKRALPAPEEKQKKKRGGKRVRRFKEKFRMTDIRKEANKRSFANLEGEYGDDCMGIDFGMLGKTGGKLRVPTKKEQKLAVKKQKRTVGLSSGATSGLASSLIFTPVQGIELVNPTSAMAKVNEANKKWFDQKSGFLSARPL